MFLKWMSPFALNLGDLALNKAGQLAAHQEKRIRSFQQKGIGYFALLALVLFVMGELILTQADLPVPGYALIVLAGFAVMVIIALFISKAEPLRVVRVVGKASRQSTPPHFYLEVDGRRFKVEQSVYEAIQDGATYTVYATNGVLLSIEPSS